MCSRPRDGWGTADGSLREWSEGQGHWALQSHTSVEGSTTENPEDEETATDQAGCITLSGADSPITDAKSTIPNFILVRFSRYRCAARASYFVSPEHDWRSGLKRRFPG